MISDSQQFNSRVAVLCHSVLSANVVQQNKTTCPSLGNVLGDRYCRPNGQRKLAPSWATRSLTVIHLCRADAAVMACHAMGSTTFDKPATSTAS
jgi:hypothetical protein